MQLFKVAVLSALKESGCGEGMENKEINNLSNKELKERIKHRYENCGMVNDEAEMEEEYRQSEEYSDWKDYLSMHC